MKRAAEALDYERAADLRDRIHALEEQALLAGFEAPAREGKGDASGSRGRSGRGPSARAGRAGSRPARRRRR
jgi:hypothetical protein